MNKELKEHIKSGKADSFVLYRLPFSTKKQLIVGKGLLLENGLEPTHLNMNGFVFEPFDNTINKGVFISSVYVSAIQEDSSEISEVLMPLLSGENKTLVFKEGDFDSYKHHFEAFYKPISAGKIDKAILSRIKEGPKVPESKVFDLFMKLAEVYSHAFVYVIKTPYTGVWMGAGPELLLKFDGEQIQTVSLAGTLPNDDKVQWHKKELVEQQLVTDYMQQVLSKHSVDDYKMDGPNSVSAGQVKHLRTDFYFPFPLPEGNEAVVDLLYDLHPTPAVCGMPKQDAHNLIIDIETYDRSFYSGFLGPVNNGLYEFYVNIRCMQINATSSALYVGGGLTNDSELKKEWEETELKAETLLSVLKNI